MQGSLGKVLCMVDLSLTPEALDILKKNVEVDYMPFARDYAIQNIHKYDALWIHVDNKIDEEILKNAHRLKAINCAATGTNHIDKEFAAKKGIKILCIAEDRGLLNTFTATAEIAWVHILSAYRLVRPALSSALEGKWEMARFRGEQLSGSTLGVLGVGRLGRMTVEYGKGFRMRVLGCDLKEFSIPGVERVSFDRLLSESDAISIHIHMTPENYHLFNKDTFSRMKDGSILVNTSRGDVIDENALIEALESGKLKAFGADVLHDEWREDMSTSPVIKYAQTHANVTITPHIGGNTTKSLVDARVFSAKKLVHYLKEGEELHIRE